MKTYRIAVLPGDGIGPEVIAQAVRVLEAVGERFELRFALETFPIGAAAVRVANNPLPPATRAAVVKSDAVLLGAVGDPSLDSAPRELRPETGLLALRKLLDVYANLRPVTVHQALLYCSPLKPERLRGVDLLVVRELTGGLYYGEPRGRHGSSAVNTLAYSASEIDRVAQVAFEAARGRRRLVTSVDKANVLEVSQLWRETVARVARDYPEVRLEHSYVDTAAMRLISDPATFDVVLTENMFGDILSDLTAGLIGGMGMAPSADIGDRHAVFQPCHGTAPDIMGQGKANPTAMILSAAMMLDWLADKHGLESAAEAGERIERAVDKAYAGGIKPMEFGGSNGTADITKAVIEAL